LRMWPLSGYGDYGADQLKGSSVSDKV
jgi:hypothetical protein